MRFGTCPPWSFSRGGVQDRSLRWHRARGRQSFQVGRARLDRASGWRSALGQVALFAALRSDSATVLSRSRGRSRRSWPEVTPGHAALCPPWGRFQRCSGPKSWRKGDCSERSLGMSCFSGPLPQNRHPSQTGGAHPRWSSQLLRRRALASLSCGTRAHSSPRLMQPGHGYGYGLEVVCVSSG